MLVTSCSASVYTGITMSTSDVCRVSFRRLFEMGITLMEVTVHPGLVSTLRATCEDRENPAVASWESDRDPLASSTDRGRERESSFGVRARCTVLVGCRLGRGGRGWEMHDERGPHTGASFS